MASLLHKVFCTPVVQVYTNYAIGWAQFGMKQSKWAVPGIVGGVWFVFPAFNFGDSGATGDKTYKFVQEEIGTPPQVEGEDRERAPDTYVFESAGIGLPPQLA